MGAMVQLRLLVLLLVVLPVGTAHAAATHVSLVLAPDSTSVLVKTGGGWSPDTAVGVDFEDVAPNLDRVRVVRWGSEPLTAGAGCVSGDDEVTCTLPEIDGVRFEGGPGNDELRIDPSFRHIEAPRAFHASGGAGSDTIDAAWNTSSPLRLVADGGPGADAIYAGHGRSILAGGPGGDHIFAGADADVIVADDDGHEPDYVDCGGGADRASLDSHDVDAGNEPCVLGDTSPPPPGLTDPLIALLTVRLP